MSLKVCLLSIIVIASSLLLGLSASAQRPALRTSPHQFGRPPIYDLFQQRRGILPNYYQFYRPQQQLQQNLRMQQLQLQRQGTAIQAMQNQWLAPQQSEASLTPTGRGSGFMNYSHFYPGLSGSR